MTPLPSDSPAASPGRRLAPLATNLLLLLLGVAYLQLCRDGVVEFDHEIHGYSTDVALQIALFCAGWALVARAARNRWTLRIVLGVALVARLIGVFTPEFLSSDVYRYVWDGRVQAAGINPYRYVPSDPHLQKLRDDDIYLPMNRKDYAHTIYPPGAQMLFLTVTRMAESEALMKAVMVAFEAVACWAMLPMLDAFGRRRELILLYAWHPLCVWEIGSSGHLDGAAIGLVMLAALARLKGRSRAAALWITAAAMVKLYPLVLWPALVRRGRDRWTTLRTAALCAGIVAAGYACYSSVGAAVFGFLPGYATEEGLGTGARYFLLALFDRIFHVQAWPAAYIALCAAAPAWLAAWAWRTVKSPLQAMRFALAIATVVTVLFSPHYVWYFLWLIPFAVLTGYWPVMVLTLGAAYGYSLDLAMPPPMVFAMNSCLYGAFAAAVAAQLVWVRLRAARMTALPRMN